MPRVGSRQQFFPRLTGRLFHLLPAELIALIHQIAVELLLTRLILILVSFANHVLVSLLLVVVVLNLLNLTLFRNHSLIPILSELRLDVSLELRQTGVASGLVPHGFTDPFYIEAFIALHVLEV